MVDTKEDENTGHPVWRIPDRKWYRAFYDRTDPGKHQVLYLRISSNSGRTDRRGPGDCRHCYLFLDEEEIQPGCCTQQTSIIPFYRSSYQVKLRPWRDFSFSI